MTRVKQLIGLSRRSTSLNGVLDPLGSSAEQVPLVGVGGEQPDRVAERADGGVERRREVVDEQHRALVGLDVASLGGGEDAGGHRAGRAGRAAGDVLARRSPSPGVRRPAALSPRVQRAEASKLSAPSRSRRSRPSAGQPRRSGTQVDGITSARSLTASNGRRSTSPSTRSPASVRLGPQLGERLRGERPADHRALAVVGSPSLISVVPRPPWLMKLVEPDTLTRAERAGSLERLRAPRRSAAARRRRGPRARRPARGRGGPVVLVGLGEQSSLKRSTSLVGTPLAQQNAQSCSGPPLRLGLRNRRRRGGLATTRRSTTNESSNPAHVGIGIRSAGANSGDVPHTQATSNSRRRIDNSGRARRSARATGRRRSSRRDPRPRRPRCRRRHGGLLDCVCGPRLVLGRPHQEEAPVGVDLDDPLVSGRTGNQGSAPANQRFAPDGAGSVS